MGESIVCVMYDSCVLVRPTAKAFSRYKRGLCNVPLKPCRRTLRRIRLPNLFLERLMRIVCPAGPSLSQKGDTQIATMNSVAPHVGNPLSQGGTRTSIEKNARLHTHYCGSDKPFTLCWSDLHATLSGLQSRLHSHFRMHSSCLVLACSLQAL